MKLVLGAGTRMSEVWCIKYVGVKFLQLLL
jgi:hypothetical protein